MGTARGEATLAPRLHVGVELLDLTLIEERVPGRAALRNAALAHRGEEDVARYGSLRRHGVPEIGRERAPQSVGPMTAIAVDMEPLPALVFVVAPQQTVASRACRAHRISARRRAAAGRISTRPRGAGSRVSCRRRRGGGGGGGGRGARRVPRGGSG